LTSQENGYKSVGMELSGVRRLRTQYRFQGGEDGFALAGWLILDGNTPEGRKVTKLIRDLQRLMSIWPNLSLLKDKPDATLAREIAELKKLPRTYWTRVKNLEVNKLTRSIRAQYKKLFEPPAFLGFTVEGGKKRTVFHRFPSPRYSRAQLIAESLDNLGKLGLLDRIRQCRCCGRWLFAKFERQWFCSGGCREKAYRASPEGKKKRREFMQRYRANLKRMEQNFLKASARARG
jgi:hypothetical protein